MAPQILPNWWDIMFLGISWSWKQVWRYGPWVSKNNNHVMVCSPNCNWSIGTSIGAVTMGPFWIHIIHSPYRETNFIEELEPWQDSGITDQFGIPKIIQRLPKQSGMILESLINLDQLWDRHVFPRTTVLAERRSSPFFFGAARVTALICGTTWQVASSG